MKQDPVSPLRLKPGSLLPDKPDFRIQTDEKLPLVPSQSDLLKDYPENYNFDRMKLPASASGTGISYKQFILPAALIGYGTFETVMAANNVHLGNYAVHNQV
ncbi:MAG: hypothetical protein LUE93_07945 [Bacteroides sp.]|nr:hypothetical protein [Bacteroides sp.]